MSRHRNVRSMNYTDEYDGYDDVYGHSLDDDYCISPSDAAFIYDRDGSRGQQKIGAFLKSDEDIAEEDETELEKISELDDIDKAKLDSCVEKIKSTISEVKISEQELKSLVLKHNFEVEKVIDVILSSSRLVPAEKQAPIIKEKDFNNDFKSNSHQGNSLSFSSLSNLVSSQSSKIQVPKLFSDNPFASNNPIINNISPSESFNSKVKVQLSTSPLEIPKRKIEVPKLFTDNSVSPSLSLAKSPFDKPVQIIPSESSSHTSLSSLVSSHLGNSGKIQVPKLFNDSNSPFNSNLKINFNEKINPLTNNLSKCNINSDNPKENDWHIDLSDALRTSSNTSLDKTKPRFIENEVIFPKNVDPFIHVTKQEKPKDICEMDLSKAILLKSKLENRVSNFGKIICRRFKIVPPQFIFSKDTVITNFNFDTPSPDDLILKFLRRK